MRAKTGLGLLLFATGCGQGGHDPGVILEASHEVVLEEQPDEPIGQPVHIAVHHDGRIGLVDRLNPGVSLFSMDGDLLGTFGSSGRGPGEIASARLAVFWPEDRIGVVGEGDRPGVFLFDIESGAYLETVPLEMTPSTVTQIPNGLLFGGLRFASGTSLSELRTNEPGERSFGPIPDRFVAGSPLTGIFHRVFAAPLDDGAIVIGFEPLSELVAVGEGIVEQVPRSRRRGTPDDLEERIMQAMGHAYEEVFAQGSVLSFLTAIGPGLVLLIHQDLAPELPAVPKGVFMTVVDLNDRKACVDTPVPFRPDTPATFAWHADRLGVLQQEVGLGGAAPTVLRWYTVDLEACDWADL